MTKAVWQTCPGIIGDGRYLHSMRDFCSSCSPWWETYPTCPTHQIKLKTSGYCPKCRKYYDLSKEK